MPEINKDVPDFENNKPMEMETENHELKDKIMINQTGLIGSLRHKTDENDNTVYFGYKEPDINVIHCLYNII